MSRAVVLLSGGLDSTTTLAVARRDGHTPYAMTFRYGQRHAIEVDAARRVAGAAKVADHVIVDIDLRTFGGSALTGNANIPKDRSAESMSSGVPITYVPARNTILLSYALGLAEASGATAIVIAANSIDYSGYVDCRPEFYAAFQEVARLGTKRGVEGDVIEIRTPLIRMSKGDIVRKGEALGVPWALTWSCYHGKAKACGVCDSCQLRRKGFREAGIEDPLPYAKTPPTNA